MMQFNPSQQTLLAILGDGSCHSGSELGLALGISRSAIWKHINQLIALGVPVIRMAQQGYKLANPLILLNEQQISAQLKANGFQAPFNLHLFGLVDSTNRYLKELPVNPDGVDVCCAEIQTQGRGRFGRHWHSPFGENIYCSSRWGINNDLSKLSGLSLVISLAVLATIKELTLASDIAVKWPNDLLWGNKKLCGTLIEISAESNANAQIIVGIGLNVNTDTQNHPLPEKPWCSLYEITQCLFDRNLIISKLMINIECYLTRFLAHDLSVFMDEWHSFDYLANKQVTVTQASGVITGIARGISPLGQLIVEDENKQVHYLASGDASLAF